ncbi:glycine-rich cell wall protein (plasmid) [Sinorhizobium sojae CCBAU 05684]|uniref:Glycine-rich cell wall protein n=1 Tax=Sinorhizobium sojae CCBAU 05684 TaxID=716928 RepID=A0A249PH30_9HYPH|nr:hypothetical protein [Sinorhizobium sojae]ASY65228.1 glycine-rich cell wall protein [Sinorhizobium sojae CCBAU 05684]
MTFLKKTKTTRRKTIAVLFVASVGFVALPYKVTISGSSLEVAPQSALAKNEGKGNGGGSGNSGGNGRGGGNGGGSSKGRDNSSESRSSGNSGGSSARGASIGNRSSTLRVRHAQGISEEIRNGRYIMKDARGRTIVNRRATEDDQKRLLSFID